MARSADDLDLALRALAAPDLLPRAGTRPTRFPHM
jgi:hypothetical protein